MSYAHTNSKGVTYYLNAQITMLRGGREQRIYFFSKDERAATGLDELPADREIIENSRTGLPILKRKAA